MSKQKELERNVYIKPKCNVLSTYTETLMVNASGNAGEINPGEGAGDAKEAFFWDDEDVASVSQNWGE